MFKNLKPRKIVALELTRNPDDFAKPRYIHTNEGWDADAMNKIQITRDQTKMAQYLIDQSDRVIKEVNEDTNSWQREVNHHLRQRAVEIEFLTEELNKQRKTALMEEESLTHYSNRILMAVDQINSAININHECMKLRETRIGTELCDDEVNRQLRQELKTLKGCEDLIKKTYHDTMQLLQRLGSAKFLLDKDIEQKSLALRIDGKNLDLKESMPDLGVGIDLMEQHCNYSLDEWQRITSSNIDTNAKELNSVKDLRCYIDLILKQICEDLQNQTQRTNYAFTRRIRETREIKRLLEDKHAEVAGEVLKLNSNIGRLQHELADKQRSLTLCQTRLSNRAKRPNLELTCDLAQKTLYSELQQLQCNLAKLNQKLAENKAMLRYMTHTQLMQEEEINLKANTLKIDEVECQSRRELLMYSNF